VIPEKRSTAIRTRRTPNARLNSFEDIARVRYAPPMAPGMVAAANFQPSWRSTRRWRR